MADDEWDLPTLAAEYTDVSALLVKKSELVRCFTEDGRLIDTLTFVAKGDSQAVRAAFTEQALSCTVSAQEGYTLLTMQ